MNIKNEVIQIATIGDFELYIKEKNKLIDKYKKNIGVFN